MADSVNSQVQHITALDFDMTKALQQLQELQDRFNAITQEIASRNWSIKAVIYGDEELDNLKNQAASVANQINNLENEIKNFDNSVGKGFNNVNEQLKNISEGFKTAQNSSKNYKEGLDDVKVLIFIYKSWLKVLKEIIFALTNNATTLFGADKLSIWSLFGLY